MSRRRPTQRTRSQAAGAGRSALSKKGSQPKKGSLSKKGSGHHHSSRHPARQLAAPRQPGQKVTKAAGLAKPPPAPPAAEERLNGARLNGARLNGARLNGARLNGARLNGARLNGARLTIGVPAHPVHPARALLERIRPATAWLGQVRPAHALLERVRPAQEWLERARPATAWLGRVRPAPTWLAVAVVVGIGGVALFLRVWQLGMLGFNSDEAVYAGQAASLAGNPDYVELFPVFRAHPMLFQSVLSPFFQAGVVDVPGRVVVAAFGVGTVVATYLLGARLYGRRIGGVAALIVAVMPYHVVVTRQVLLDGPMVFFATLTLYCVVRFVEGQRLIWFVAAGGMLGLSMLAKETSVVLAAAVYAFLALVPSVKRPIRSSVVALCVAGAVLAAHPVSQALAGHTATGKNYLVWQLFRRPNHSLGFYLETVPVAIGLLVLAALGFGLWWRRRERSWRETLLLCWIVVPIIFFQLWPVKGFQYLLPIVAPVAVLAARGLVGLPLPRWLRGGPRAATAVRVGAVALVAVSLLVPTWSAVSRTNATTFLAGSGGVPGGRETGQWLAANTPEGSRVLTLGPSMANIIQYYGHRRSYGLSVSPNPLHRNPSYEPLPNPDLVLRDNELQYIVWDKFSAERSPYFSERLLTLARRFHGRVVHTEFVDGRDAGGNPVQIPIIIVYEVRP